MEKGYFAAAWGDVTKSPGWASVVLRLGLLCLIPIFGVVVMYGYLFSWARDIAWNVHRPLPRKIFANEDGSLYRRGFFIFVVALVLSLVPELVNLFIGMSAGFSFGGTALYGSYVPAIFGSMIWLAGNSASVALSFLAPVIGIDLKFACALDIKPFVTDTEVHRSTAVKGVLRCIFLTYVSGNSH